MMNQRKESGRKPPVLAIVVPCLDEEETLCMTHGTLLALLRRMKEEGAAASGSRLVYVDDGSRDSTWELISGFARDGKETLGIRLAWNAGHQNALIAGMEAAAEFCDAAVTIDADLQDDPEAIPLMAACFAEGNDIVFGVRRSRKTDPWLKRVPAQYYYRLLRSLGVKTVYNHADFRLMSARAIRDFLRFGERNIYIRGVVPSLGYSQATVYYDRRPRVAGSSKYPWRRMLNFAADGITSFSVRPVRMVLMLGVGFLLVALAIFIYVMIRYFGGETIEGWTSLILSIWFCTGVVLLSLGIIGEYIGKIYTEVKQRPRYSVECVTENIEEKDHDRS